MPGLPDVIIKAPVFHRMEALSRDKAMWSNSASKNMLDKVILDLGGTARSIVDIAKDAGLYDNDSTDHFEEHWLNSTANGYWKSSQKKVNAVLRAGMKRVCEEFKSSYYAKPLEFFWAISGDHTTDRWEMSIHRGPNQITVIFHTPQPNVNYPNTTSDLNLCVVKFDVNTNAAVIKPVEIPVVP